jgi:NAD(P)-dependent dehydrogenase (short-subunit alcohol dehydrogenase family)
MRLEGKVALITGAARGIGAEISRLFTREGAKVVIADIKEQEGRQAESEINAAGGEAHFMLLDVTSEESWQQVVPSVVASLGKLDILVNNAGISLRMPLEEFPVETWDSIMAVNVKGVFLGMKHAIPPMRKGGGGCIINMSSIAGLVGHKHSSLAYIASKGAVTLLTKATAVHHAKDNIRVNSIHPCTVDTPLVADLFRDPERKKARFDEVPMGRLATTQDVAYAALYLASDEASFITGVGIPVDGGVTAY